MPAADTYFITWKGRRDGPYSLEQLTDLLERGEIGLLHRVETQTGLVPLRDLLPAPTPTDIPPAKIEYGLLGPPPTPEPAQKPAPVTLPVPVPALAAEIPVAIPSVAKAINPEQATRLYTICGLCFIFPPLAGWSWMLASQLVGQGNPLLAERLKWLSLCLAIGGILLWVLLWRMW